MPTRTRSLFLLLATTAFVACGAEPIEDLEESEEHQRMHALLDQYATVRLEADVSHLSDNDQEVVRPAPWSIDHITAMTAPSSSSAVPFNTTVIWRSISVIS